MKIADSIIVRNLGFQEYLPTWEAMRCFTHQRTETSIDELWLLQHPPVFTQGQAGKPEHILNTREIPIVQCDRGGQITYHGPGQLMIYTLFNLSRFNIGPKQFVQTLESVIIQILQNLNIHGHRQTGMPGIYVGGKKICSIGLRIHKGFSYHGLALNIDMDLTPFQCINPCGHSNLKMTQISNHCSGITIAQIEPQIVSTIINFFSYTHPHMTSAKPEEWHEKNTI